MAAAVAVFALGAAIVIGSSAAQRALLSYLFVFVFLTGLGLGSLALLMIGELAGGAWFDSLRAPLMAAARTLPLQAVLALPLIGSIPLLYPWAQAEVLAGDPLLRAQRGYLNPGFFVIRTILYFALWLSWLWALSRPRSGRTATARARTGVAASGLIVFALSTLFAAADWIVSLLPHWHSTVFGMLLATGWMLSAAALAVLCRQAARSGRRARPETPQLRQDLGNLLLMFVLASGYLAYMQYLTIWIADLPAENSWYISRTLTSWRMLAWVLIGAQFAIPFALLLSRRVKRQARWLSGVAALLLLAAIADSFWLTVPSVVRAGLSVTFVDLLVLIGMGMLWLAAFQKELHRPRPDDPLERLEAQAEPHNVHG